MTKENEDALRWAKRLERSVQGLDRMHEIFGQKGPKNGIADRQRTAAAHLRRLVAENEALNHYRKVYGEVSAILACTAEMPPPSDDDEITVQRLKALVQDFAVYVDSCEAKADRIDRLGETIVRLRAKNEAKDALLRQAVKTLDFAHDALMDAIRVAPLTHQPPRAGAAMQDCAANSDAIRQHLEGKA